MNGAREDFYARHVSQFLAIPQVITSNRVVSETVRLFGEASKRDEHKIEDRSLG